MPLLLLSGSYPLNDGSPRGAIHLNEDPKDYVFRAYFDPDKATTRGSFLQATAYEQLTWGAPYVAGTTGIEVFFDTSNLPAYTIRLTTPWGTWSWTDTTWLELAETRFEVDQLSLTVDGDCNWSLSFDELRFYTKIGAGAWALKQTISAQAESGSGFDLREDILHLLAVPIGTECIPHDLSGPAPLLCPGGAAGYLGYTDYSDSINIDFRGGWIFFEPATSQWTADPVSIHFRDLPGSTCSCAPDYPVVWEDESWDLRVQGLLQATGLKTAIGSFTCHCPTSGFLTVFDWKHQEIQKKAFASLNALPETSGIDSHQYYRWVDCLADYDLLDETVLESLTYCEGEKWAQKSDVLTHCRYITDAAP
ncbi:hypothetical protein KW797_04075, partial [Candidatus Parcubacteria bacterium]|nr:hypothetical protein [Candidatus Parcubacteria bacterium]